MKTALGVFMMFVISAMIRTAVADENVKFSGTLVALPCTIPASDQQIPVHFGTVNVHDLYLGETMPRLPFVLHLNDCDPNVAGRVSVTFSGTGDPELPGLLGLDSSQSGASGVAIGLESAGGDHISLNKSTSAYELSEGDNVLPFRAYIAGEPDALKQQAIQTGDFNTTAVLELSYE